MKAGSLGFPLFICEDLRNKMPPSSRKKSKLIPNVASLGFFLLAIPVGIAIVGSLWLAATAAKENIKFARGSDQILSIISAVRDDASKDANFATLPNDDLVDDLVRLGQLPVRPVNPWEGALRASAWSPTIMRIEVDLPPLACQRLGIFFGKEADDVSILKMEAREGTGIWRQFYLANDANAPPPTFAAVNAACGKSEHTTLALTIKLRKEITF
jgi:hypothetical protein